MIHAKYFRQNSHKNKSEYQHLSTVLHFLKTTTDNNEMEKSYVLKLLIPIQIPT